MNTFVNSIGRAPATSLTARTLNGMRARATTSNAAVDLFGSIGAMRGKNVIPQFVAAFNENQDLALRIAQWARDVRGGSGERQIYRDILLWLEANQPQLLVESRLLDNLPELGRFDDLLIFTNPQVKFKAFGIIAKALDAGNGLAAKWLPRKGPLAVELRNAFGLSPKEYRKTIVNLTKVVEQDMCAKNWNEINFSHVPSVAMSRYMTAFHRNAPERFEAYKAALKAGTKGVKVNASAVFPYDVTKMVGSAQDLSGGWYNRGMNPYKANDVAQAMWESLPNYMNDRNAIAVVDNSGSMTSRLPNSEVSMMDVAVSLGIYVAEKSTGAFKDLSITFNDNAKFVKQAGPLHERMYQVTSQNWGSTNLHSVFNLILDHACCNSVPQADMPATVIIMSDMQFNSCRNHDDSALQMIRRKYEDAGYEMPQIVFWNLNHYGNHPARFNDNGVALISGFSPAIMATVLGADPKQFSPEAIMLKTVGKDRYNW